MFENCNALKSVYVNKFDVGSATVNNMFRNCYSITGGNGTKYSGSKSAYVRIDGGSAKPGYLNKVGWIKKGNKWTYKKLDGSLQTGWMNLDKNGMHLMLMVKCILLAGLNQVEMVLC